MFVSWLRFAQADSRIANFGWGGWRRVCDKLISVPMDQSAILKRLEKFEGRVRHMYRCTGGEVTAGIGHAILRDLDALELQWTIDGRAATPAEIHADYAAVKQA